MHERLAQQIRGEMSSLIDRYDVRLREIPGYAGMPQQARHSLERRVLELIADCLETNNDQSLIGYVRERAGQVLAAGFKPEWFQRALAVPEEIVTPLVTTLAESNFVWQTLNRAQQMTWHIVAEDRMRLELEFKESLARRGAQVQVSTHVAQEIAAATDLNELFHRVVTLIKERFNYYHAQLFRYDVDQDAVVLVTGYGEAGLKMLAAGHKLALGRGVVGAAAATGLPLLATDVSHDKDWRPNPNLPDTRGELAVPIKLRDQVLGILDVQSDQAGALTVEDQLLLEGLCGQIAVAIENRRVEDALREREEDLDAMLEYSPEAIGVVNTQTGLFENVNRAAEQLYGLKRDELIKVGPAQMSPEFQPDGRPSLDKALEKIGAALKGEKPVFEWVHVNAANTPIQCEVRLVGLTGVRSHLVRFSVTDIRERKQAEETLAAERNLIRTLIDTLPDLIYAKDVESRFILANVATARQMGAATADELLGKSDLDFYPRDLAREYLASEQPIIRDGKVISIEEPTIDADGQARWQTSTKVPLRSATGDVIGLVGITADITARKLAEESLREIEERFRVIAETSPIPILISRVSDGTVLYGNDHLGETFGIPISDLIGRQTPDFYFDVADRLPLLSQLKRDGILRNYELHVKRADGTPFWVLVSMQSMTFDGQPALLSAFYDITERKQIEETLRRNEAELSGALKIAKLAYWEYDVEKDLFLFNDQFYAIFHTTAEQAGGYQLSSAQYAQQFVHPDDLPIVGAEIEQALHSTDQHYSRQLEHRILYGDGGVGYISVSVNIDRDEQGRILRYYGANQDITERRQVEEALAQEQSLMRALMDTVTDTIYFKDLQSRFLRISRSQASRFHLSDPTQAAGKTDFDFFTEEHAWPAYEDEQEIIRTGQPISREERETWADRPDSWALTTKYPLRDEAGHIIGTFGRSVDITDRKQAEAERERLLTEQQRRTVQLQTAAEVSRAASSVLNTDKLLPRAVDLIRTRFNLYYAGIFLLDEKERWAILRAGTGEAGQQMLANNHRLKIGGNSMISRCVSTQQARIALDVGEEAVRFDNPLLPLTRSEMALPLVSRGHVIGAMTIQSDQPAAFAADDITVLQTMADQISNAVDNARLYEQAQAALQEVDAINRRLTGEAWDTYLRQQAGRNVIWTADDEAAAPAALSELDEQLTAGEIIIEPVPEDETEATVTVPVLLRGQPIGAVRLRMPLVDWDDDTETLLADITGHIAQAVENARLIEQTQRTAQRERMINEINARVRQSIDLDAILRTAVNELGQSLGAARVVARVGTPAAAAGDGRGKTND